jgi:hypothetical protein
MVRRNRRLVVVVHDVFGLLTIVFRSSRRKAYTLETLRHSPRRGPKRIKLIAYSDPRRLVSARNSRPIVAD